MSMELILGLLALFGTAAIGTPESTAPIPFESGHPYKRGVQGAKKKKVELG